MSIGIQKLICDCCGAAINDVTYKCEYCGTQYVKPKDGVTWEKKIISVAAPVTTIGVRKRVGLS